MNIISPELNGNGEITVDANTKKNFTVILENTNAVDDNYLFYYKGTTSLPSTVKVGYSAKSFDPLPPRTGYTVSKSSKRI